VPLKPRVLVVDDELGVREMLEVVLENAGFEVTCTANVADTLHALEQEHFDCVVTDLRMGTDHKAGMKVLGHLQEHARGTPAIMMTAYASVDTAIEAMRLGAFDYLCKPFQDNDEIRLKVRQAIAHRSLLRENEAYRKDQRRRAELDSMVGHSPAFQEVLQMVRKVATLPSTVAIHGESGAGKELVARALHSLSDRRDKPFVAINCGGIPENLLESELFGYKKGAFTGATEDKEGLFVVANGGTVFLDEVGEMPLMLQVKLLRVLDNNLVTPVGGTSSVKVDVRLISATNRDLAQMAEEGRFRKDLYYRLNVIPIQVPPLRERRDDIPLLARHFVQQRAERMGLEHMEIAPDAMELLCSYDWPGNVRELGNVIERSLALCGGDRISVEDLPVALREFAPQLASDTATLPPGGMDMEAVIAEIEMSLIRQALDRAHYSQKKASDLLGLTPRSLRYRLQKYGLDGET
jgi:two-component system response regulator PilR (NtrC family)